MIDLDKIEDSDIDDLDNLNFNDLNCLNLVINESLEDDYSYNRFCQDSKSQIGKNSNLQYNFQQNMMSRYLKLTIIFVSLFNNWALAKILHISLLIYGIHMDNANSNVGHQMEKFRKQNNPVMTNFNRGHTQHHADKSIDEGPYHAPSSDKSRRHEKSLDRATFALV